MADEFSAQILAKTAESLQKLYELCTRTDERVRIIQERMQETDQNMEQFVRRQADMSERLILLERRTGDGNETHQVLASQMREGEDAIIELDRRLTKVEIQSGHNDDRWNKIATFIIQIVWVVLASYVLMKMNLQSPQIP